MKRQVITVLSIAAISFLIGTLFNMNFIATGGSSSPWDRVWTAITGLESRVETLEEQIPERGFISIPGTQFLPQRISDTYFRNFTDIRPNSGWNYWWASLQLPHGVSVTNMTAFLFDGIDYGYLRLELLGFNLTRNSLLGSMAEVETSLEGKSSEVQVLYDDTINYGNIDNENCEYGFRLFLSNLATTNGIRGIIISYEYQA